MKKIKKIWLILLVATVCSMAGFFFSWQAYGWYQNLFVFQLGKKMTAQAQPSVVPSSSAQLSQSATIIRRVKEILAIDEAGEPTLLVIKNVEELRKNQQESQLMSLNAPRLYDKASNGDVVVMYPTRLVIYSPSQDKIIAVVGAKK